MGGLTRRSRDGTSLYGFPRKDIRLHSRAEALLSESSKHPEGRDLVIIETMFRRAAEAAQTYDGEVELRIDFE